MICYIHRWLRGITPIVQFWSSERHATVIGGLHVLTAAGRLRYEIVTLGEVSPSRAREVLVLLGGEMPMPFEDDDECLVCADELRSRIP